MEPNEEDCSGSFESPESGTIVGADYDASTETLTVVFRRAHGWDTYRYPSVPQNLWNEFLGAPSKGACFAALIRPFYTGRKQETL